MPQTASIAHSSARWMAPELLDPEQDASRPTEASDIYAFAMVVVEVSFEKKQSRGFEINILWQIFSGNIPFYEYRDEVVVFKSVSGQTTWEAEERPWARTIKGGLADDRDMLVFWAVERPKHQRLLDVWPGSLNQRRTSSSKPAPPCSWITEWDVIKGMIVVNVPPDFSCWVNIMIGH